jgi:hypothetical protein
MCGFCNVWLCVCLGFLMCGCVYVWVLKCVGVCMCGFCNVWVVFQWRTQEFCSGGSTNSVEDRGQREGGSGGGSPLVRFSAQFAILFVLSNFRDVEGCYGCIFHGTVNSAQLCQNFGISGWGGWTPQNPPRYVTGMCKWGSFDNYLCVLVICVLVFTVYVLFVLCFCIVSFTYIYSHLFCLYWCKDYCHRVTTQLH